MPNTKLVCLSKRLVLVEELSCFEELILTGVESPKLFFILFLFFADEGISEESSVYLRTLVQQLENH